MKRKPEPKLEALHLVALRLDAIKKQGTPEYAKASALADNAVKIWKKQLWGERTCPHCGHTL